MSAESFVLKFKEAFESSQQQMNGSAKLYPNEVRKTAFESFLQHGIPTTKNEEWKYINLFPFLSSEFSFVGNDEISKAFSDFIVNKLASIDSKFTLVLVNGKISKDFSKNLDSYPASFLNFDEYYLQQSEDFSQKFQSTIPTKNLMFENLSTALSSDGFVIEIGKKVQIEEPLYLLNFIDCSKENFVVPTRYMLKIGTFSNASMIEQTFTFGEHTSLSVPTSEIFVEDEAQFSILKIQNDVSNSLVIDSMSIAQKTSSVVTSTTVSYGSSLIRNNHRATHNGSNVHTNLFGLVLTQGKQLIDNHTEIDHATAHCSSTESYKQILADSSTVVFNGKVFVREQAQKTNAYQSNKTILLSDSATINSKPQLEIFADDVKCSHGATCGGIDEDAIFYLRSRGISPKDALSMLTFAFAEDVLMKIENESVKTTIENDIRSLLSNREN
jgi:Fe-S cluster assembly protein SufD